MDKIKTEILVIGGGASGLSAGISATKNGAQVIIVDREEKLGGILKQCIHNGFGLKYYKKEMTGPEYANNLIIEAKSLNIPIFLQTSVTSVKKMQNGSFKVKVVSPKGLKEIIAKAVILAMGCRERTAASISLGGTRPVGVISAGSAQKMINIYGQMIGKNVVIVGSGDVGLIMARRLYFEGANVLGVYEINSIPSGLNRNIVQCLNDYNIPLHLSETVVEVLGKDRVTGVVVAKVNPDYSFDLKTRRVIPCDTILLSVGLVPENDLVSNDIEINKLTSGAFVDDSYQTSVSGLFSCGNVLHVHDIVDDVTLESIEAGKCAALYVKGKLVKSKQFKISTGNLVRYSVPSLAQGGEGFLTVKFRVTSVKRDCFITARLSDGTIIAKRPAKIVLPAQMEQIMVERKKIVGDIIISVEEE